MLRMSELISAFNNYSYDLFSYEQDEALALKDHIQIPIIIDTLCRKKNHHVVIKGFESEKIFIALLKSIALHLTENPVPRALRDVRFIYFDAQQLDLDPDYSEKILTAYIEFIAEIEATDKHIIFAVNLSSHNKNLNNLLLSVLMNEKWHLLTLATAPHPAFNRVKFPDFTELQIIALLKTYKTELENFHKVVIPDEIFAASLAFTTHYLASHSHFDKALELLESAAARVSALEYNDPTGQFKSTVTSSTLAQVVASWTQIPFSHLTNAVFNANKFSETLKRRIFGQDIAITLMGSLLEQACVRLQEKNRCLCNFLLVGPPQAGKRTSALALSEHFFGHKNALLRIDLTDATQSIADIKIMSEESHCMSLLAAIHETPNAVILIENVHHADSATLSLFKNILTQGFAFDAEGNKYDFRRAMIVMTTTLGSERITALTQAPAAHEVNKTLDLMDLVLNEHLHDTSAHINHQLSSQELCDELNPILESYFPTVILENLHIIPFLPLDYAALEKIMRLNLKLFAKRLEMQFDIELNYAPEIIKFLAHEALWRKPHTKSLEKILSLHLYSVVAKEIIANADNTQRPKRLAIQLNETGQLLRCEFSNVSSSVYV